jgi:predicted NAD/FAD-dependent oxidoreductase
VILDALSRSRPGSGAPDGPAVAVDWHPTPVGFWWSVDYHGTVTGIAIVGAGMAGLAAADALRETDLEVTVFERRDEISGRATTRSRNGCVFDCGANYVKSDDGRVSELICSLGGALVDVRQPVYTFDAEGTVSEGRDDDDHKWTYTDGIAKLGRLLVDRSEAELRRGVTVTDLRRDGPGRGWRLAGTTPEGDETDFGGYAAVVFTPPGPKTGGLIADAEWNAPLAHDLDVALSAVPYRTIHSVALHYPFAIARPYYALVNVDRGHEVGWIAREECKRGHVPNGETLLIVQMAPDWSRERFAAPGREITARAAEHAADVLDDGRLTDPDWTDLTRWRHALPDAAPDRELLERAAERDLHFAGDWVAGDGRVHLAIRSGLAVADRIVERHA